MNSPSSKYSLYEIKDYIKTHFKKGLYKTLKKEIQSAENVVFHNKDNLIRRANFTGIAVDPTGLSFYKNGLRHRESGPASILVNGDSFWYLNNALHREDGPAEIKKSLRYTCWYHNGVVHRESGPALIFYNDWSLRDPFQEEYFLDGVRHRESGPAVISKHQKSQYFYKGTKLSKKKYRKLIKNLIKVDTRLDPFENDTLENIA